jgi:hypothetical protein
MPDIGDGIMRQTWPPVPEEREQASSFWTRLAWCHTSTQWTIPLTLVSGFLWLTFDRNALFVVLTLASGIPCALAVWRAWREAWLARHGERAAGTVTKITTHRGATPIITVYRISYAFRDKQGRSVAGKLRSTRPANWMFYKGKPVEVRYDPRKPRRNTLASI